MILLLKIAKRNGGRKIARKLRDWYPGAISVSYTHLTLPTKLEV